MSVSFCLPHPVAVSAFMFPMFLPKPSILSSKRTSRLSFLSPLPTIPTFHPKKIPNAPTPLKCRMAFDGKNIAYDIPNTHYMALRTKVYVLQKRVEANPPPISHMHHISNTHLAPPHPTDTPDPDPHPIYPSLLPLPHSLTCVKPPPPLPLSPLVHPPPRLIFYPP